jgi:hypothetical protein
MCSPLHYNPVSGVIRKMERWKDGKMERWKSKIHEKKRKGIGNESIIKDQRNIKFVSFV